MTRTSSKPPVKIEPGPDGSRLIRRPDGSFTLQLNPKPIQQAITDTLKRTSKERTDP